jgi:hypothetical protein
MDPISAYQLELNDMNSASETQTQLTATEAASLEGTAGGTVPSFGQTSAKADDASPVAAESTNFLSVLDSARAPRGAAGGSNSVTNPSGTPPAQHNTNNATTTTTTVETAPLTIGDGSEQQDQDTDMLPNAQDTEQLFAGTTTATTTTTTTTPTTTTANPPPPAAEVVENTNDRKEGDETASVAPSNEDRASDELGLDHDDYAYDDWQDRDYEYARWQDDYGKEHIEQEEDEWDGSGGSREQPEAGEPKTREQVYQDLLYNHKCQTWNPSPDYWFYGYLKFLDGKLQDRGVIQGSQDFDGDIHFSLLALQGQRGKFKIPKKNDKDFKEQANKLVLIPCRFTVSVSNSDRIRARKVEILGKFRDDLFNFQYPSPLVGKVVRRTRTGGTIKLNDQGAFTPFSWNPSEQGKGQASPIVGHEVEYTTYHDGEVVRAQHIVVTLDPNLETPMSPPKNAQDVNRFTPPYMLSNPRFSQYLKGQDYTMELLAHPAHSTFILQISLQDLQHHWENQSGVKGAEGWGNIRDNMLSQLDLEGLVEYACRKRLLALEEGALVSQPYWDDASLPLPKDRRYMSRAYYDNIYNYVQTVLNYQTTVRIYCHPDNKYKKVVRQGICSSLDNIGKKLARGQKTRVSHVGLIHKTYIGINKDTLRLIDGNPLLHHKSPHLKHLTLFSKPVRFGKLQRGGYKDTNNQQLTVLCDLGTPDPEWDVNTTVVDEDFTTELLNKPEIPFFQVSKDQSEEGKTIVFIHTYANDRKEQGNNRQKGPTPKPAGIEKEVLLLASKSKWQVVKGHNPGFGPQLKSVTVYTDTKLESKHLIQETNNAKIPFAITSFDLFRNPLAFNLEIGSDQHQTTAKLEELWKSLKITGLFPVRNRELRATSALLLFNAPSQTAKLVSAIDRLNKKFPGMITKLHINNATYASLGDHLVRQAFFQANGIRERTLILSGWVGTTTSRATMREEAQAIADHYQAHSLTFAANGEGLCFRVNFYSSNPDDYAKMLALGRFEFNGKQLHVTPLSEDSEVEDVNVPDTGTDANVAEAKAWDKEPSTHEKPRAYEPSASGGASANTDTDSEGLESKEERRPVESDTTPRKEKGKEKVEGEEKEERNNTGKVFIGRGAKQGGHAPRLSNRQTKIAFNILSVGKSKTYASDNEEAKSQTRVSFKIPPKAKQSLNASNSSLRATARSKGKNAVQTKDKNGQAKINNSVHTALSDDGFFHPQRARNRRTVVGNIPDMPPQMALHRNQQRLKRKANSPTKAVGPAKRSSIVTLNSSAARLENRYDVLMSQDMSQEEFIIPGTPQDPEGESGVYDAVTDLNLDTDEVLSN